MKIKLFPLLTIVLFALLVGVMVFRLLYQVRTGADQLIAQEVQQLVEIFKRIDKKCEIIDFDYQKNPINFLNVKSFVGSEVASMNLAFPDQWEGPYLNDNPTIQQQTYMVVDTKKGYFITPGEGVVLANGKVIGKDIILDKDTDIPAMMQDKNMLMFEGKALAAPLPVGSSTAKEVLLENIMRAEDGLVFRSEKEPIISIVRN